MRVNPSKNAVRRRMDFAIAPKPVAARESAGSTPSSLPEARLEQYGTNTTDRSSSSSSPRKRRRLSKNAPGYSPEAGSKGCSSASGSKQASSKPEASRKQPDMRLEE